MNSEKHTSEKSVSTVDKLDPEIQDCENSAPDGGWGWLIVLASFFVTFTIDGVCYTFGVFLVPLMRHFDGTESEISWAGSFCTGMFLILGPVASALADRYGFRVVAFIGMFSASLSFFVATFCPSLTLLVTFWGVLGGISFGLAYLPAIVIVGLWFDKKRGVATGLCMAGTGAGTIILPPLSTFIIEHHNWKIAVCFLCACMLACSAMIFIYRPVPLPKTPPKKVYSEKPANKTLPQKSKSAVNIGPQSRQSSSSRDNFYLQPRNSLGTTGTKYEDNYRKLNIKNLGLSLDSVGLKPRPMDVYSSWGSLNYAASPTNKRDPKKSPTDFPTIQETESVPERKGFNVDVLRSIVSTVDFSLLLTPSFLIFALSSMLCFIGFYVPFVYVQDYAVKKCDVSEETASTLISLIGIANTLGRVLAGVMVDQLNLDCLVLNYLALIGAGCIVLAVPFTESFGLLAVLMLAFGFCTACIMCMKTIVVVRLVGVENLSRGFGIILMGMGIASILGTPLAGALYNDSQESYLLSFASAGLSIVISGLMCIPLGWISRKEYKKASLSVTFSYSQNTSDA